MKRHSLALFSLFAFVLLMPACIPSQPATPAVDTQSTLQALQNTQIALAFQLTTIAGSPPTALPKEVPEEPSPTPIVVIATQPEPPTAEPTATETEIPLPTETLTPVPTQTPDAAELTRQFEARILSANVLVYDEPDAQGRLVPRLGKALEGMRFSGGNIANTNNYLGNFDRLLRNGGWDLVIMAVESRDRTELGNLGVLDGIMNHVNSGGALIVETWNLDEDQSALGQFMLSICNAHVEKDWHHATGHYIDFYIPALSPASPVFNKPNSVTMPLQPSIFWPGDAGDLIRINPNGQNRILAGLLSDDPNNYGLLTSCLDGRVILQTFSTHDYPLYDTVRLWQNMMYYTLSNKFAKK